MHLSDKDGVKKGTSTNNMKTMAHIKNINKDGFKLITNDLHFSLHPIILN